MKIAVVGLGPGDENMMTPQAREAILQCDVVVGYDLYLELISHLTEGKQTVSNGMKREVERCEAALEIAKTGKSVAMVCSGDAGVYGMAGVMLEVAKSDPQVEIEVIPGITAACSAAAVLGAPLIHDFAIISLSDLLTPWEKIEKRLSLAAEADFVICIYNPRSKKRRDHLDRAVALMLAHKDPNTPCGIVRNIGRDGEEARICELDSLHEQDVDMFTTIIVGNSQTMVINNRLVTPRGYKGV